MTMGADDAVYVRKAMSKVQKTRGEFDMRVVGRGCVRKCVLRSKRGCGRANSNPHSYAH